MKWGNRRIKDFAKVFDGPHATPKESNTGPIFLGIKNIKPEGGLDLSEIRHISETEFEKWTKRVTPQNQDIVLSYEATLHRYAIIPEDFIGCLGRRMALVRVDENEVFHKFLYYTFLSDAWRGFIDANKLTGATVDRISITDFPNYQIQVPPLPTQRRIASILSAYDDLIDNNLKRIKLLEEKAFLRYKGIINSEKVESISVFDYAEIMSGGTPSTTNHNYWEGEIPFFTPKDLSSQTGYYLNDTERKLTDLGLEKCNSKLFPRDTIFITARGTVGKLVLAKIPSAISQSNYAITTRNGSSNYFLFLALIDKIDHFKQLAVGGVFDTIIVDTFKMIFIELPNELIVNQFNIKINPIFSLIDTLQKQNNKLREARDILLPRLMSGEIEV